MVWSKKFDIYKHKIPSHCWMITLVFLFLKRIIEYPRNKHLREWGYNLIQVSQMWIKQTHMNTPGGKHFILNKENQDDNSIRVLKSKTHEGILLIRHVLNIEVCYVQEVIQFCAQQSILLKCIGTCSLMNNTVLLKIVVKNGRQILTSPPLSEWRILMDMLNCVWIIL